MPNKTGAINADTVPVAMLLARFKEAKKAREKVDKNWERNVKLYRGQQWDGIDKLWFQTSPVYNKIFEFVETMRSMLADNRWGLDALPRTVPGKADNAAISEKAEKVNKLLDFLWDDTHAQGKLAQVFLHVFLKGTGFLKTVFDPDSINDSGIGQIVVVPVDPFYIYPDPDATCVEDAAYIIEAKPVSWRWISDNYPKAVAELKAKGGGSTLNMAPMGLDTGLAISATDESNRIDLYECWYKHSAVTDFTTDSGESATKAKYPDGRYTLMTESGIVLDDKANSYGAGVYTRFLEIPMPGEFWGGCTVDRLASIQVTINQIIRSIVDNGLWLIHGIWVVDEESGVDAESLGDYGPRDVVVKKRGTDAHRDGGAQLPPHVFQTLQQQVDAFDRVAGLPDVLRGIVGSRQPVETVQMQQESGEVRTRERSRRVEEALSHFASQLFAIVATSWADKRAIRNVKATGGFDMFELSKKDLAGWEFDIQIRPGSTLPMDRSAALAKALELRSANIQIPDAYLLRLSGLPNIESAVAEMEAAARAAISAPSPGAADSAVPVDTTAFGPADTSAPVDNNGPSPQDLANMTPEEQAAIEAQGGMSQFP